MTYKNKWLEPSGVELNEPLFYTSVTVPKMTINPFDNIKTGFYSMDDITNGLTKGEVSIVSGLNGSGKSSWLSMLALNVVEKGDKVALFSGELRNDRVFKWLQLQAAGKTNTMPTDNQYVFYVRDETKIRINEWLEQNLFVYNNHYGESISTVLDAVEDCVVNKKSGLVILDNLMRLDLSDLSQNNLEQQKELSKILDKFAEYMNVHIILVAHPRKVFEFLRKTDIAGTSDITNAADNVFIIHRVNEDFKRLTKQMFGWRADNSLYGYSNVIEVCKARELGGQDMFAGLYYEKESKRFLNTMGERIKYGWERAEVYAEQEILMPFDL